MDGDGFSGGALHAARGKICRNNLAALARHYQTLQKSEANTGLTSSVSRKEDPMRIQLLLLPGKLYLQAEGLKEETFDRFHPHAEPGSDRVRFDDQVKATAASMSVTVQKAMNRLELGIGAWALITDSDTALELAMNVAEPLGIELQL
jgi:hypothetical protein